MDINKFRKELNTLAGSRCGVNSGGKGERTTEFQTGKNRYLTTSTESK